MNKLEIVLENLSPSCQVNLVKLINQTLKDNIHSLSTDLLYFTDKETTSHVEMENWLLAAKRERANLLKLFPM
jgi:hypothetical protein